jgi:hypothetical protein
VGWFVLSHELFCNQSYSYAAYLEAELQDQVKLLNAKQAEEMNDLRSKVTGRQEGLILFQKRFGFPDCMPFVL